MEFQFYVTFKMLTLRHFPALCSTFTFVLFRCWSQLDLKYTLPVFSEAALMQKYFIAYFSVTCCPHLATPPDSLPKRTKKTEHDSLWQFGNTEEGQSLEGRSEERVFKFCRMSCNTLTVSTQNHDNKYHTPCRCFYRFKLLVQ